MYQQHIRETLHRTRDLNLMTIDPRAVEALMRCEYGTLDALSPQKFNAEAVACARELATVSLEEREAIALSFGL